MKRSKIQVGDCCYFLNPLVLRPRPHKWPKNATCWLLSAKPQQMLFPEPAPTSCFWFTIRAAIWSQQRDNLLILVVNSAFQLQQMFFFKFSSCFWFRLAPVLFSPKPGLPARWLPKYANRKFSVFCKVYMDEWTLCLKMCWDVPSPSFRLDREKVADWPKCERARFKADWLRERNLAEAWVRSCADRSSRDLGSGGKWHASACRLSIKGYFDLPPPS